MDAKEGEDHEQKKVLHVNFMVIIRLNILDIIRAVHSGLATFMKESTKLQLFSLNIQFATSQGYLICIIKIL
jgi:hypothetical protein